MSKNVKRMLRRAEEKRGWIRLSHDKGLLWEKEVIYDGDWEKKNSAGDGIAFAVRENTLEHWKQSLEQLREAGVKSPLAKSHETWDQPADHLGEIVGADVRENDQGQPSLFLRILFDDEQSRDIGLKGDVSIGSPEVWYDGTGREWNFPLQHVASTNAPVIPGLEAWRKIAASFSQSKSAKGQQMDLDELIKILGIKVDASVNSDDGKKALIMAKLQELTGDEAAEPGEDPNAAGGAPPDPKAVGMSHEEGEQNPAVKRAAPANQAGGLSPKRMTVAFAHPVIVKTVRDSRLAQLDALVTSREITPAVKKELALAFCSEDQIKLELSHADAAGGQEFERAIKLVKLTARERPLSASGRSAATDVDTAIELSHQGSDRLVKNMELRAAAFAGQK